MRAANAAAYSTGVCQPSCVAADAIFRARVDPCLCCIQQPLVRGVSCPVFVHVCNYGNAGPLLMPHPARLPYADGRACPHLLSVF